MANDKALPANILQALAQLTQDEQDLLHRAIQHVQDEEKKNAQFVQWTLSSVFHVNQLAKRHPAAHQVLMTLIQLMNKQNRVGISQKGLAYFADYSVATIKTATKYLEDNLWIERTRWGNCTIYAINSRIFWQGPNNARYAVFNAPLVLLEVDIKDFQRMNTAPLKHLPLIDTPNTAQTLLQRDLDTDQGEMDV